MKKNRRRSHLEPPVTEEPAEQPAAESARRRLRRVEEEPPPESPVIGALSGQLPPGVPGGSGAIVTDAGRYLRQAARDEAPSRFGSPAGDVDESARRVWEIAFGLMVRRRFDPEAALAEISRTVAVAAHDHAAAGLALLDAEMLVRAALGESVPVGDIDEGVVIAVHLLLFASLADELALGDAELDAIIAEAEEKASALMAVCASVRRPAPPSAP
ncbi:hypothetical protein [Actinoplanes subtropicus]|uniref:hypothetical protein n=1 Tax=Actinoplanes subtropicus TaxID=543632 RepID=UPI0004C30D5B|nr:hypothetical protein [Actinoplanes subtropicus]